MTTLAPARPRTTPGAPRVLSVALGSFWTGRGLAYAVFLGCVVALVLLRGGFMRHNGVTVDEFIHLQAGYRYLQCGEFGNNPEHPPLVKLIAALPIRNWQLTGFPPSAPCGQRVITGDETSNIAYLLSQGPHYSELLWKARSALLVFPLLLLTAVFFATRRWFGDNAAIIAALLITLEPTLLAHSSLITTDAPLATFAFIVVWLGIEFVEQASWVRFFGVSLALGLALACKHSALILPVILLCTMLLARTLGSRPAMPVARLAGAWICMCAIAVGILWAGYGFRYAALPHEVEPAYDIAEWLRTNGMSGSFIAGQVVRLARSRTLPEAYVAGLTDIVTKSARQAYLFGKIYPAGIWYYFPVALAIKTTLGVLLLFAMSLLSAKFWAQKKRIVAPLLAALLIFFAAGMISRMNIGVRHLLAVYPFLIVLAAGGASVLMQKGRAFKLIVFVLVAGSLVSGVRAVPAQLSYANEIFGGPNHLFRYLGDSNLDWGQSRIYLDSFLVSRFPEGSTDCAVAQGKFWTKPPRCLQLPVFCTSCAYGELDPILPDHFEGTLIIQPYAILHSSAYLPYMNREPDEIAGNGTILIYRGKFDLRDLAALRRFHRGVYLLYVIGDPRAAEAEFAAAEADCPASNRVDLELKHTIALTALERWDEAIYYARQVLRLTENDPSHRRERQMVLDALQARQ